MAGQSGLGPSNIHHELFKDLNSDQKICLKNPHAQSIDKLREALINDASTAYKETPTQVEILDEDKCLKMILNPEFVENLSVLK